jgi:hypothetical protein
MAMVKFVVAKEDKEWVDLSWTPSELLPVQNTSAIGMSPDFKTPLDSVF